MAVKHFGIQEKDPLNLKGTCRTLDGSNGDNKRSELENGLISRSGWAVIDDSWKQHVLTGVTHLHLSQIRGWI